MKNIIVFILVIIGGSCSTIPQSPFDLLSSQNTYMSLEEMNRTYPYWNVKLFDFEAANLNAGWYGPNNTPTPEDHRNAKILNIRSKEIMLEKLNTIRFVVNTPEFGDLLRTKTFYSSRTGTGPFGSIKIGDPMDSERLLKIVQKISFYTRIKKTQVPFGAEATANIGKFLYVAGDEEINNVSFKGLFVQFPNKWSWERYATSPWITEVLFHELVHNMGFTHDVPNDATYGLHGVFSAVYNDPKWKKKYKKQLDIFQYYTKKYENELQKDTIAGQIKHIKQFDNVVATDPQSEYTYNNEIEDVCILYPDGTHKLVKMRNGRVIS